MLTASSTTIVSFPELGWGPWTINRYLVEDLFGKISIAWYGVIICVAMIVACAIILRNAVKKEGANPDSFLDFFIFTIPIGVVGARTMYVLAELDQYDSFAEAMDYWNPDKKAQAYIIALGVNDLLNMHMPVGDADTDVSPEDPASNNLTTFAGYYGLLVSRLKAISPRAKFFFMTMPRSDTETPEGLARKEGHRKVLYRLAERFGNAYVLDFFQHAPVYDRQFRENFYLGGHMNPCGYLLTAKMVASYIDYIIRHNMADFKEAAFIGTDLHYGK